MRRTQFINRCVILLTMIIMSGSPHSQGKDMLSADKSPVKIQLIRNATMKINYAGKTFLTDPMLSDKFALVSRGAAWENNPTVDLPIPAEGVLNEIDFVLVSHIHGDHFDDAARDALSKTIGLLCQPIDCDFFKEAGFNNVMPVADTWRQGKITIARVGGQHATFDDIQNVPIETVEAAAKVSGFVFQSEGEPTLYWVGDSVLCEEVINVVNEFSPDIIVTHSGGAAADYEFGPIIMDEAQTLKLAQDAKNSIIVAIHLESLSHCSVKRDTLRSMADSASIPPSRFIIPEDGETIVFDDL